MEDDIIYRLKTRAEIRRSATTRKSVQEGAPDRIADLLEEAADEILNLRFAIAKAYARLDDGGDRRVVIKDLAKALGENEDVY